MLLISASLVLEENNSNRIEQTLIYSMDGQMAMDGCMHA